MLIVGLTGSIGMGKSTAAACFLKRGIPVFDADAAVHDLYGAEAVALIEAAFPGTTTVLGVDRMRLSAALEACPERFSQLEQIIHPLVREREITFLRQCELQGFKIAVLDIPLLYEAGLDRSVDVVVVVSAAAHIQHQRVLARPGMTEEKLAALLARQMPDAQKRARAQFVVDTNGSVEACCRQIDAIIDALEGRPARAYFTYWADP